MIGTDPRVRRRHPPGVETPRRRRFSRPVRARLGYLAGVLLAAVGVGWEVAPGWGLVTAGAGVAAMSVWLYDVSESDDDAAAPHMMMWQGDE